MAHTVRIISRLEREARIRDATNASTDGEDFYDFRNEKIRLKVIRIQHEYLIYRMENFRTFIDQKEYATREGKPSAFFLAGQENETVQQVQHDILAKLARTGKADSVMPVIDVLRKERQRERLLITHTGVVINGNRRLAGMRELYSESPSAFAEFSHVWCMVLPQDATAVEILDIEANLQAKPEVKLDYDWIGDCQLIAKLASLERTPKQIAKQLNRKVPEIENSLQALIEADIYLKDWAKAEGEYGRVRDAEQLFKDIPPALEGKAEQLKDASRAIAWTLFENKDKLDGRLYNYNVTFGKRAADVLDRMADELGMPLETVRIEPTEEFAVDVDDPGSTVSYENVIAALRKPESRDEVVETLIDSCVGVIESEQSQKSGRAALKAIAMAHAKLSEIDFSRALPETYAPMSKQMDAIEKRVAELKKKLGEYISGTAPKNHDTL